MTMTIKCLLLPGELIIAACAHVLMPGGCAFERSSYLLKSSVLIVQQIYLELCFCRRSTQAMIQHLHDAGKTAAFHDHEGERHFLEPFRSAPLVA